jgi:hypothetical protein
MHSTQRTAETAGMTDRSLLLSEPRFSPKDDEEVSRNHPDGNPDTVGRDAKRYRPDPSEHDRRNKGVNHYRDKAAYWQ